MSERTHVLRLSIAIFVFRIIFHKYCISCLMSHSQNIPLSLTLRTMYRKPIRTTMQVKVDLYGKHCQRHELSLTNLMKSCLLLMQLSGATNALQQLHLAQRQQHMMERSHAPRCAIAIFKFSFPEEHHGQVAAPRPPRILSLTTSTSWAAILLLIVALLNGCEGTDSFCQTQSGQVCRQNDNDPTIYQCDIEEPTKNNTVLTFNEGETIELLAVGDKSGFGCSFEIKDTEKDVTCCFIHDEREEDRGKRLCGSARQPKECRQPGSGG